MNKNIYQLKILYKDGKMKKFLLLTIILFMTLGVMPSVSFAAEGKLIKDMQISLKSTETPKRLEVGFYLAEPIDLTQVSSNIIYEYFTQDSSGNLESMNYKKNKSWSGYLNSYDNYPSGERKYSSGSENNTAYSDNIPADAIYTSVKSSASIDVTLVTAVKVTVLRSDGSGEKITVYSDGTTSPVEKIEVSVATEEKNTGIRLESTTAELPVDTVLTANEVTAGSVYEKARTVLEDVDAKDFIIFEIRLEADGNEIQPDGKVKISIPVPERFDTSNLAVYRIDADGTKTLYTLEVTAKDGVEYATFETDHFSIYVLADISEAETEPETEEETKKQQETEKEMAKEKDETPKTGTPRTVYYIIPVTIISAIGIIAALRTKTKIKKI